ncbi:uncharacterized protein LOC127264683 [Andrographis paniculata]|uniref:uncharacterized protein LOC127264683 n=1 Tax=Andrographis paniculata TaxID=175694 RepID=UPI0021E90004|nr:uncharacterized protein LOC127264683 [Andrographis paniculata]
MDDDQISKKINSGVKHADILLSDPADVRSDDDDDGLPLVIHSKGSRKEKGLRKQQPLRDTVRAHESPIHSQSLIRSADVQLINNFVQGAESSLQNDTRTDNANCTRLQRLPPDSEEHPSVTLSHPHHSILSNAANMNLFNLTETKLEELTDTFMELLEAYRSDPCIAHQLDRSLNRVIELRVDSAGWLRSLEFQESTLAVSDPESIENSLKVAEDRMECARTERDVLLSDRDCLVQEISQEERELEQRRKRLEGKFARLMDVEKLLEQNLQTLEDQQCFSADLRNDLIQNQHLRKKKERSLLLAKTHRERMNEAWKEIQTIINNLLA